MNKLKIFDFYDLNGSLKMMLKKLIILPALCTMLFCMQATGNEYYTSSYDEGCCSDWTVYADWLYWRVRNCNLDYALISDTDFTNYCDVRCVEPSYSNGYRVGIQQFDDCRYLEAFYTHLHSEDDDSVGSQLNGVITPTRMWKGNPRFGRAQSEYEIDYDVVDIVGGYAKNPCCNLQTYCFGGLKLAFIDQELNTKYTDSSNAIILNRQSIDMNAYGLDIGFGANYTIGNCLNLFGRFSYDLMAANYERDTIQNALLVTGVPGNSVESFSLDDNCWTSLNIVNLSFGIGYESNFCGCWVNSLAIYFGYEFHQYLDMLDFYSVEIGQVEPSFKRGNPAFGVDGLMLRVAVGF